MAANQNEAPASRMVGYLLGLGPMPPPCPQDIALAQMHRALNGGIFEHPWAQNVPPPGLQVPQQFPAHPAPTQLAVPPAGQHATRGNEEGQCRSFTNYSITCFVTSRLIDDHKGQSNQGACH
jgi:hypothetical protein